MADRLEWFTITIPAGTTKTSPLITPCVFQQGDVTEVDVIIPPGPQGNVGFFISAGGSQYIPRTAGSFVVPDHLYFQWPLANAINSGSWSVTAYNTDLFSHTLQFGFQVNEIGLGHISGQSQLASESGTIPSTVTETGIAPAPPVDPLSPDALVASLPPEIASLITS